MEEQSHSFPLAQSLTPVVNFQNVKRTYLGFPYTPCHGFRFWFRVKWFHTVKLIKWKFTFWNRWSVPKRIPRITTQKRFFLNKEFIKNEKMSVHIKLWLENMMNLMLLVDILRKSMDFVKNIFHAFERKYLRIQGFDQ